MNERKLAFQPKKPSQIGQNSKTKISRDGSIAIHSIIHDQSIMGLTVINMHLQETSNQTQFIP